MRKLTYLLISIIIINSYLLFTYSQENTSQIILEKINSSFTYKNNPIHPGLIKEFSVWLSDTWEPKTVTVDVIAAYDTNEYSEYNVEIKENDYICLKTNKESEFCYKWLGKLDNNIHVVKTSDYGGGSGIFKKIYFVKFDKGKGFTPKGDLYDKLLMTIVRKYSLGDRDQGDIKIFPTQNKVAIGKSRYREKSVELYINSP